MMTALYESEQESPADFERHSEMAYETMRLSVDFRYQLEGEALTPICLQPHFERLSWDEIYADWQSDELQYYWRDKDYVEVPWNPALHELPPEHVDEAYEQELAFSMVLNRRREQRSMS